MIRKILFLVHSPFNQRDFQRFGIELLMKNNFEVEVWDITDILHPDVRKNYTPPDPIDWPYCRVFDDKDYALNAIKNLCSEIFIIVTFYYSREYQFVWRAISASKAKYAVNRSLALPSIEIDRKRGFLFYFKKLQKVTGKRLVNYAFLRLPFTWLGMKPASLVFVGGQQFFKYSYIANKTTEIVWAHTLDYDLYLKERDIPSSNRHIAVFLDAYLPFHPDFIYMGIKSPVSADKYYSLLNKFFKVIEDRLGLEVIIAAHPCSHYENYPDYFQGHKWVRGQTIKLVKECQLVLSHRSTALNFANLFYKPVIFLTSSNLDRSSMGPLIRAMANWFGKEPIFIDGNRNIDWGFELTVNKGRYDNYRRAYIKTDHSEDLPFWQIVANRLKKGF